MRRTQTWHSPRLQRDMSVACWGHFGKPVLLFPTAGGDFLECERFLMVRALRGLIDAGRIKLYACGSVSRESWMDKGAAPAHKSWLQGRFDAYLREELCPFILDDCGGGNPGLIAAGASLGAYNAVNASTKHPDVFDGAIAMSGTYFFDRWMHGHWDENYYFNMPVQFIPRMGPGREIERLRQRFFLLASGTGRWEAPDETAALARIMEGQGIPHHLELWGEDADHDWPTWRTMLPMFLDRVLTRLG
ncbi:MAG: alpha/beta hydrolase-fold protein [Myxococcota bacterium]|nr:alpha/beta hydrolase-fold protein [Myxococcota bacterium]